MTHEFRTLIQTAYTYFQTDTACVMASVVALDGSSYRKPGVRMLIAENGTMTGAVSGGCVEKEVVFQAQEVFETGKAKMMTYDGRYRLGCEGILYILIEPLQIDKSIYNKLTNIFEQRKDLQLTSYFVKNTEAFELPLGTVVKANEETLALSSIEEKVQSTVKVETFTQVLPAVFQLFLFGAEHDAVQLGTLGAQMGWDVRVIASPKDPKTKANFPGVHEVLHLLPEQASGLHIDAESAVVLMNHNYATDLNFLVHIIDKNPEYIGILGSSKRREKLFNELLDYKPELDAYALDRIYGPAGLDIGAITPQEIALAVLAELLALKRGKTQLPSLRDKIKSISKEA
ncbi:MAG TPA: XshC-Cox1-family protein [Leeuwenhoekiella sp.]|uniref:XdhC family protein n=1 Tax=Leeuwenhoekiella palythoae TaxID=573501 RepID=UPI000C5906D7|nr:XdhC/CoxI family protein [Leeuwenhoekiella palythoae]MAS18846.1 XshC-Cox1-family protein [Leeuwenhoekiella sp.]UBZ10470.1 XdhC family protein [Leeuwenhoekiella palythoae]HAX15357.1 XshC-Cox1-family protein [Leeuwenhoekiella sp.]HBO28168.1 XshC-Cox1-family protein [Leeuwenhoekiella sp.]HCQ75849.1 XshC-Cox1-family protein [Leeuwenhoekiella sp.]|tara:strand:+ start:748 stop:1779 length:1032 start_codon:yes stop_codon:yes gene_type:complete